MPKWKNVVAEIE
jgi:ATP-dependent RNA helicase DDX10/DBP4